MIQALCWVLIHSLWQGVLLALAGGLVILTTRRSTPAVRYRLLCGLSTLFLAAIGVTAYYEWTMATAIADVRGDGGPPVGWLTVWCSKHSAQIVTCWLMLTVLRSVWLAAGLTFMQRMRREGMMERALLVARMDHLARQLGIRRTVKLVESKLVRMPMVIGQLRPIIFIPLGMINHLPADEMEAVLLHELAHIRRYDHVVNLVQQVAECLLCFNPGFLWISSLVKAERENCCDELAIAHTQDRVGFVRALVRFKEHSLRGVGLAFPGNKRQLLHRVMRISRQENSTLNRRERYVLLGCCSALLFLLAVSAGRLELAKNGITTAKTAVPAAPVVDAGPATRLQPPPAALTSVLQTREQVSKNMEWVQAQLRALHRQNKKAGKNNPPVASAATRPDGAYAAAFAGEFVAARDQESSARELEAAARRRAQVVSMKDPEAQNRAQVSVDKEEADDSRARIISKLEQDEKNRQLDAATRNQDEKNRQQAEKARLDVLGLLAHDRSRERSEAARLQANQERDEATRERAQADLNRQQADLNRQQAERDRLQADRDRALADQNREEAERDRQQAQRDREQAERDRQQAIRDRAQAERDRQQAEPAKPAKPVETHKKADLERKLNDK